MPFKDKQKEKEYKAANYQKNKKRLNALNRKWIQDNPEKFRAIQKRYMKSEKGKIAIRKKQKKFQDTEKSNLIFRKQNLKRSYNMTLEDYDNLFNNQNGVCLICKNPETNGRRLSVDHDHKTGKIRGLLCQKCNTLLGCANDSIDILLKSIEYLRKHQ